MTLGKRAFDLVCAVVLLVPLLPLGAVIAAVLLLRDGRPIFFVSERMRAPGQPFGLLKFRTMSPDPGDRGVTGRDKMDRITPTGAFLRRTRLDEIPQIWNILRGDMSFVGPRPPLRQYVDAFPALYAAVLRSRPGVTGLATLIYKDTEARLLSHCATPEETEAVYVRRCIPRKAALDLAYQRHATLCWDLKLMFATVVPVMRNR